MKMTAETKLRLEKNVEDRLNQLVAEMDVLEKTCVTIQDYEKFSKTKGLDVNFNNYKYLLTTIYL